MFHRRQNIIQVWNDMRWVNDGAVFIVGSTMPLTLWVEIDLLHNFAISHIQVAVANPLYVKPVSIAFVATALKLHLQHVHGALDVAAAWHVRIPVVAHGITQAPKQWLLQIVTHAIAHQGSHKDTKCEEKGTYDVRQHQQLPSQELSSVHTVIADLSSQEVDRTGSQANTDKHVWHWHGLFWHQLPSLRNLHL